MAFASLQAPLTPTFADPTRTATGFTVQITNFDTESNAFTFAVTGVTPAGSAEVDGTGLVTVGVDAGAEATVTVSASRTDFVTGTAEATAEALDAALTPDIDDAVATTERLHRPDHELGRLLRLVGHRHGRRKRLDRRRWADAR